MRIICLNFSKNIDRSFCEAFVAISPQVQFRAPHFIFIDVDSTSHLHGGEEACLLKSLAIAKKLISDTDEVYGALADRTYTAQLFSTFKPVFLSARGQDRENMKDLPLDVLMHLEGLKPWPQKQQIHHIIEFLKSLGVFKIDELLRFRLLSLKERWGEVGETLRQRLQTTEMQIISPFLVQEPLYFYHYFEDPAYSIPVLKQPLQQALDFLFLRLEGRQRFARKLKLELSYEYSKDKKTIEIEPVSPSRDGQLFLDLALKKIEKSIFQNPIREFEIDLEDAPEKVVQLDFFETRDLSEQKWQRLLSFAAENNCQMGFLQSQSEILPEKSFTFIQGLPQDNKVEDKKTFFENALQIKQAFSKNIESAPRPSLLLQTPQALKDIQSLQFLSRMPTERLESSWWNFSEEEISNRDYYFALNSNGQLLWVFQDRMSENYYLHGYFD